MKIENDHDRPSAELNYETIDMPSASEGKRFLKTLREHGILTANLNDLESRMKLVELGITMPKEKDRWLLYDCNRPGDRALYIFFRLPAQDRNRNRSRMRSRSRLIALRFDIARYQSNPLTLDFEVGDAAALFCRSVAVAMGFDYAKCELGHSSPGLN
jgi:hypothetical protein